MSDDKKGVTIRQKKCGEPASEYRFYSDEEISELFDNDANTLVIALLNRAQKAEAERDKAQEVAQYLFEHALLWSSEEDAAKAVDE